MAIITDIEKLRPELLTKSRAELARLRTEIDMADNELARREEVKAKEELAATANKHIDAIVEGIKWLHDNGLLPEKITPAFSRTDGMFAPGMHLRNVTAESLAGAKPRRSSEGMKRIRRTKAEIEALKAAGEYKPRRSRSA